MNAGRSYRSSGCPHSFLCGTLVTALLCVATVVTSAHLGRENRWQLGYVRRALRDDLPRLPGCSLSPSIVNKPEVSTTTTTDFPWSSLQFLFLMKKVSIYHLPTDVFCCTDRFLSQNTPSLSGGHGLGCAIHGISHTSIETLSVDMDFKYCR